MSLKYLVSKHERSKTNTPLTTSTSSFSKSSFCEPCSKCHENTTIDSIPDNTSSVYQDSLSFQQFQKKIQNKNIY